jgi:DNA-binding PadR family transcriptional regulator
MDLHSYGQVRDLFQTAWDPAILDVIAGQPSRFVTVARRVRDTIDPNLVDGNVTRSLNRLRDLGLIQKTSSSHNGRPCQVYRVTDQGRHTLDAYTAILDAYRNTPPRHHETATR